MRDSILDEEWRHDGETLSTQIPRMGFSHPNTMRDSILDEEWRHDGETLSTQIPRMGFGCCHEMAATPRQRA